MKVHEPWGAAAAAPKINIRARGFDWDSNEPIPGEQPKKDLTDLWHGAIEWATVIDVVLIGVYISVWWYHGGFYMMAHFMWKHAGDLMSMILRGFW